jgi:hypothetical protein
MPQYDGEFADTSFAGLCVFRNDLILAAHANSCLPHHKNETLVQYPS